MQDNSTVVSKRDFTFYLREGNIVLKQVRVMLQTDLAAQQSHFFALNILNICS